MTHILPTLPPTTISPTTIHPETTFTTTYITTTVSTITTHPHTIAPTTIITTTTQTPTETTTQLFDRMLTIVIPSKTTYEINETIDLSDMIVRYSDETQTVIELTSDEYQIDTIDMSTYGSKAIIVRYLDLFNFFNITVHLPDYYRSAESKTGENLKAALNAIVRASFYNSSYSEAIAVLQESDRDPNNANNIILLYSGPSVSRTWDSGSTWDREHVWPVSLLGVTRPSTSTRSPATDVHNLKPSVPSENNSRGNKYFDYSTTTQSYSPPSNVRGDVARILFYMVIMYESPSYDLELVNHAPSTYQMGLLSSLLAWNFEDPVNDFERNRNDVIQSYQNNRNPFIDYPHFATLIWDN
jgi:endonuclease I